eukprot:1140421-Pelagomonas_calceolata.AAC.9
MDWHNLSLNVGCKGWGQELASEPQHPKSHLTHSLTSPVVSPPPERFHVLNSTFLYRYLVFSCQVQQPLNMTDHCSQGLARVLVPDGQSWKQEQGGGICQQAGRTGAGENDRNSLPNWICSAIEKYCKACMSGAYYHCKCACRIGESARRTSTAIRKPCWSWKLSGLRVSACACCGAAPPEQGKEFTVVNNWRGFITLASAASHLLPMLLDRGSSATCVRQLITEQQLTKISDQEEVEIAVNQRLEEPRPTWEGTSWEIVVRNLLFSGKLTAHWCMKSVHSSSTATSANTHVTATMTLPRASAAGNETGGRQRQALLGICKAP